MKHFGPIVRRIARVAVVLVALAFLVVAATWTIDGDLRPGQARAEVRLLVKTIEEFTSNEGRLPTSLAELTEPHGDRVPYAKAMLLVDPWRQPFYYRPIGTTGEFIVFTLGADGRIGGRGASADFQVVGPQAQH